MSGKFINKTYVNTIDNLTRNTVEKVKVANYVFNDKPPVVCKWYNLNNKATTLDEGTRAEYSALGKHSSMKYNKITDAIFYANNIKIEFDVVYEEDGLSAGTPPTINGIVLPNTWIPYQGDFFTLKHAGKEWMYKVNSVSFDTIDNGNNIYKFEAYVDNIGIEAIECQVVKNFRMIINNVGTNFKSIIEEETYLTVDTMDNILITLKNNYIALFYNERVQTFTYDGYYGKLYDPYLVEFLIRNKILEGSKEYIYVHHEVPVPRTFSIDYNDTYFRALETKSIDNFNNELFTANIIDNQYTLFSTVVENYYMIDYKNIGVESYQTLEPEFVYRIKENKEYDDLSYYNIVIRYMNNIELDSSIVDIIENIKFTKDDTNLFYVLPMIIYIFEESIQKLMI